MDFDGLDTVEKPIVVTVGQLPKTINFLHKPEKILEATAADEDYVAAYDKGYEDGAEVGEEEGYGRGYEEGYEEGKDEGYEEGHRRGYDDGYEDGRAETFEEGYEAAIQEIQNQDK